MAVVDPHLRCRFRRVSRRHQHFVVFVRTVDVLGVLLVVGVVVVDVVVVGIHVVLVMPDVFVVILDVLVDANLRIFVLNYTFICHQAWWQIIDLQRSISTGIYFAVGWFAFVYRLCRRSVMVPIPVGIVYDHLRPPCSLLENYSFLSFLTFHNAMKFMSFSSNGSFGSLQTSGLYNTIVLLSRCGHYCSLLSFWTHHIACTATLEVNNCTLMYLVIADRTYAYSNYGARQLYSRLMPLWALA